MKLYYLVLCLTVIQVINAAENDFTKLLSCNLARKNIALACNVDHELEVYKKSLRDESNYEGITTLEQWIDQEYAYPHIHPAHQKLLEVFANLDLSTVCEVGAGCGKIIKYMYAHNPSIKFTCIEHNSRHLAQIQENFQTRTHVIAPNISVNAHVLKGCLPSLSDIPSNSFNLVFTSTVMMHLPFIIAIQSALELYRISNRYILHVENKNDGQDWYNMTVVKPTGMSSVNCVGIDYVALYEKMGVKTLQHSEFKDPASPAIFVVYLGEKIAQQ